MALTPRKHGVNIIEVTSQRRAFTLAATSIWAVIATGPEADAGEFPLNVPALVTDIDDAILNAGVGGTLPDALRAIADQGRSIGVVIRVEEGAGENAEAIAADQDDKVIGDPDAGGGSRTGMQALLDAETLLGVQPRIIGAPGLDSLAVATALGVICAKLRAFGYISAGPSATVSAAADYRENFGQRELMMIYGDVYAAGEDPVPAVARAIGLRAALDNAVGYHKSISNTPIGGVTGLAAPVSFDLQSEMTEAGLLNGADITPLIRRQGFRFWGNRTLSDEPAFAFETAVRTNQVLRDTIAQGVFPYIGQPLTPGLAGDLIESINAMLRAEVRAGRLIGAECYLAEGNTPDQLAMGRLRIGYSFTPVPPLEDLTVESVITDEFFVDFANFDPAG